MAERHIEVELRYKVHDPEATRRNLAAVGIRAVGKDRIIDEWFMPQGISSLSEEEEWFDNQKGIAWRIRRVQQPNGTFTVSTTSKQHTEAGNHNTFAEGDAGISDYNEARAFLAGKNYRCWLTIDKTRYLFDSGDPHIEVVLDEIEGMAQKIGVGAALEVEFKGQATRDEALAALSAFAKSIGLDPADQFDRSFTVEAMPVLADFQEK